MVPLGIASHVYLNTFRHISIYLAYSLSMRQSMRQIKINMHHKYHAKLAWHCGVATLENRIAAAERKWPKEWSGDKMSKVTPRKTSTSTGKRNRLRLHVPFWMAKAKRTIALRVSIWSVQVMPFEWTWPVTTELLVIRMDLPFAPNWLPTGSRTVFFYMGWRKRCNHPGIKIDVLGKRCVKCHLKAWNSLPTRSNGTKYYL